MRVVLIKVLFSVVLILTIVGVSVYGITAPRKSVAIPNEIATPDQATVDELPVITESTVISTEKATEVTEIVTDPPETKKPTEHLTEPSTEPVIEKEIETEPQIIEEEPEPKDNYSYLLDIDNPNENYSAQSYDLKDYERQEVARVVMGEFGSGGFTGCALIAQAIRDAMVEYGYSATSAISNMGYYGYNSNPNSDSYSAVDYIFSGNAAVQHRILYMNNSPGGWHGTQQYVLDYQGVWFFDKW